MTAMTNAARHISRKERERLARRQEIIAAARQVFASRGFEQATLDEIAELAEFGKGTLYNYFESKEALFLATFEDSFDRYQAAVVAASEAEEGCVEKLRAYLQAAIQYFNDNRSFYNILIAERGKMTGQLSDDIKQAILQKGEEQTSYVAEVLREGISEGALRPLDPDVLANALLGLLRAFLFCALVESRPPVSNELTETILDLFLHGAAKATSREA
jgi:AcrR family transcriptional regulator